MSRSPGDGRSDASTEARKVAKKLCALAGGEGVRRKAALRELLQRPPDDALRMLDALLTAARSGEPGSQRALSAFLSAFQLEPESVHVAWKLKALAEVRAMDAVRSLLDSAPPQKAYDEGRAARADARAFTQSLGHLKSKARMTRDLDELTQLLAASEASVVRNALLNPRMTEDLVVRIAARRPARPEPLAEVWASRFGTRHAVRRALVFNPYLAPELGVKILPLLTAVDLRELSRDMGVHRVLRMQAQLLLEPEFQG